MIILSVIVPVYKAQQYLDRCVQSIVQQASPELELILVDDGSPDECGAMCERWARRHPCIRVIHQENKGLSAARNAGIRASTGKYVTFVDSDDEIPLDFYQQCISLLRQEQAPELVCFAMAYITMQGDYNPIVRPMIPGRVLLDREYIQTQLLPPLLNVCANEELFIDNYACNKLFKRSVLSEHDILFDETRRVWEDRPFVVEFCKHAQSFYYIPDVGYHYIQAPNSLSVRYCPEKLGVILKNLRLYEKLFEQCYDLYSPYAICYYCELFIRLVTELTAFEEHRKETARAALAFCDDALGQTLFSAFRPQNRKQLKWRTAVLQKDAQALLAMADRQLRSDRRQQRWSGTLPARAIRRIKRMCRRCAQ